MDDEVREFQEKDKFSNFLSKITILHVILLIIGFFILISVSKSNVDPRYNYVIYAGLLLVIAVLYFRPNKQKRLLPWPIISKIAQDELDKMTREGKVFSFDSKCWIKPVAQIKYRDNLITGESGTPLAWAVGFYEMVQGTIYKKEGIIYIHPYEGTIIGLKPSLGGFEGKDNDVVKIIPVGVVSGSFKTSEFGGEPKI